MPMYRKLTTAAAVAALAFGLAACGGGGSDEPTATAPPPTTTPDPMPPAPTPVAVTVPDAMYLDDENAPMAGSMTIMAGASYTSGGVMFSCPAGGDDCEVEVMADGSVTSTGGEAVATLSEAAMTQVAQAKKAAADAAAAAAKVLQSRVIGKDSAIERAANLATGAATADGTLQESEIRITRAAGKGASVRVTDPAGYAASDTPAMPNGDWAGNHLTRSIAGATQHLFVYTDIEPPTRIQFYNWDGDATTPSRYADVVTDAVTDGTPANAGTTLTPLDLNDGTTNLMTRGSLDGNFMSPGPAAGGNVVQRFRVASAAATSVAFKGNFNGAAGTYTCTAAAAGTDCRVTISPTGTYAETSGTWTFTPELGVTAWQNDQEFMRFGWWLQEPNNPDGAYTFRYYVDGNAYTAPTAITTGSAVYTGRAAGKYVIQEIDDTGVTGGMAGQFTAAATLTARFGAAANSISGSISGFQGEHAEASGWEVTLHRKALGAMANLPNAFPTITETDPLRSGFDGATATIGDQTAYGDWTGQYFGDANPGNTRNAYPLGVGGTFQADNDAVSIAGAFGARR